MPHNGPMGADEAMTWSALRRAVPIDTSPRGGSWQRTLYGLSRPWPFPDMAFYEPLYAKPPPLFDWLGSPRLLLKAVEAREMDLNWLTCVAPGLLEQAAALRAILGHLVREGPAAELAEALKADLAKAAAVNRQLRRAERELLRAVHEGRLTMLGSDPSGGERRPVAPDVCHFGVEICPDGSLREVDTPRVLRTQLLFDGAAVMSIWPPAGTNPHARSGEGGDAPALPMSGDEAARRWMSDYAEAEKARTGRPAKREVAINECRRANGCVVRTARAAWNDLPPDLKRPAPTRAPAMALRREVDTKRMEGGRNADRERTKGGR